MIPCLNIIKTGPMASIQDMGRKGYAHLGITQGGVADEYAFHWANKLLANPFASPVIEITLGGFEAQFTQRTAFAITGAINNAFLDEKPIPNWSASLARKGQRLTIKGPREGLRNYLALLGGVATPLHHNSAATVTKDALGGLHCDGRNLSKHDVIGCERPLNPTFKKRSVDPRYIPPLSATQIIPLRVMLGSQHSLFSADSITSFFSHIYQVSAQSNKMGYQLTGPAIETPSHSLISEAITQGAIQVPANGQPIIMLCEHQTIGGYLKLGNVARMDLPKLAQAKPGALIRFSEADPESCLDIYKNWLRFFQN
ncbi:biotin-dependent carboxyltransferase family protein [Vibrio rarus]|uniref:5-oxoprolinase subunit C family protein n=1 Tax=Vibrio rarus TaxID=413403 RepID=UPI0021C2FCC3|nr:biotin-dependent carboxyltransferase family protein [Vibrio rarus]